MSTAALALAAAVAPASPPACLRGPADMVAAAAAVAAARPEFSRAGARGRTRYRRGRYRIVERLKGNLPGEALWVEASCLNEDEPGTDLGYPGYCRGDEGLDLPGFVPGREGRARGEAQVLFLSAPGRSGLDGTRVRRLVSRSGYGPVCADETPWPRTTGALLELARRLTASTPAR